MRKAVERKALKLKKKKSQISQRTAKAPLPTKSLPVVDKEQARRKFVREKFEEWGWHSHKERNDAFMKGLDAELETTTSKEAQIELERFIKKKKVERKYFTRLLEMEYFLTSEATLVGLKYNMETKKFTASTESKVIDPQNPDETDK
jgi:hypothetical protein